jgi:large subunit ribosomal protein L25
MKIEKRTEPLKIVREGNKIPGVLFGKSIEPESIQVDEKDFREAYKEYGMTKTFEIKLGRKKHNVYIKEVQRDIVNHNQFLNVKLLKVMAGDLIKANLPINLIGKDKVEKPGVIVQFITDSVEVEYGIGEDFSHIDLDVSNLEIGDSLKIQDLIIPEGIHVVDDLEKTVVNVSETKYIPEEDQAEVEEKDAMDVEVINEKTEE